jgi:hypothetical protein
MNIPKHIAMKATTRRGATRSGLWATAGVSMTCNRLGLSG